MSSLDWITNECEKEECNGEYEREMEGGGTCNECGHKTPCI